jgi:cathepsin L
MKWTSKHQKTYSASEFGLRFAVFKYNYKFIQQHNAGNHSFTVALNQFADLTNIEYQKLYLGFKGASSEQQEYSFPQVGVKVPTSMDWRQEGAVTPVKNQQQCGSCWSFSTTGSTEGCHKLSGNPLVSLSEQNLMDCSFSYGNNGCNGGLMTQAMKYIIANNGVDTEESYPYTAQDGSCHYNAANKGATLTSFQNVQQGDEQGLVQAGTHGPVSVAIDASHSSFQFYHDGVYYEPACSSTRLDHGVLMAGWGVDNGQDYYLVKNSWGAQWGQQGYIWMSRNRNNNCGIATMATLPSC